MKIIYLVIKCATFALPPYVRQNEHALLFIFIKKTLFSNLEGVIQKYTLHIQ